MAVLGELTLLNGRIIMSKAPSRVDENGLMHCISYAAQSPWLRHQSIKDNILFGYPFDEDRYNAVVECCALKPDLEMLEDGDATEIGARYVFFPRSLVIKWVFLTSRLRRPFPPFQRCESVRRSESSSSPCPCCICPDEICPAWRSVECCGRLFVSL